MKICFLQIFKPENGARDYAPDILVIFTDGAANENKLGIYPQAMQLKQQGVRIITVSVGRTLDSITLRGMASYPMSENMFSVMAYRDLGRLVDAVVDTMCDGKISESDEI